MSVTSLLKIMQYMWNTRRLLSELIITYAIKMSYGALATWIVQLVGIGSKAAQLSASMAQKPKMILLLLCT